MNRYGGREAVRGHLAMLAFSALVGGSFSFGGLMANDIAPAALNALRFAIAAVVIGAAVAATTGLKRADLDAPWRYLVLGGLFAIYFVLMFEGLKTAAPVAENDDLKDLVALEEENRVLKRRLAEHLRKENAELKRKINGLRAEVKELQEDPTAVERISREQLGLVRKSEVVFQFDRRP